MSDFSKSLISKHTVRFNQGQTKVLEKRKQWVELVEKARYIFEDIKAEIDRQSFFKKIYMLDSSSIDDMSEHLPFIQFSFGQQPIGYKNSKNIVCVEAECTLQIGLLVDGSVTCVLYPFKSDMHNRREKYLIIKIATSPQALTEADIKNLFEQLFCYAQVSSAFGSPNLKDKITLYKLLAIHYWHHFKISKAVSGIGSLVIPLSRLTNSD